LVFPQNEFNAEYLKPCLEAGITAYRGNPHSWIYREAVQRRQGRTKRFGRLLDSYVPLTSGNCHQIALSPAQPPVNVPASRFLRPYLPSVGALEHMRLKRIKNEMSAAAEGKLLYHLWWHPHNFGADMESNLVFLRSLLEHYRSLNERHGFESATMGEVANLCLAGRTHHERAGADVATR